MSAPFCRSPWKTIRWKDLRSLYVRTGAHIPFLETFDGAEIVRFARLTIAPVCAVVAFVEHHRAYGFIETMSVDSQPTKCCCFGPRAELKHTFGKLAVAIVVCGRVIRRGYHSKYDILMVASETGLKMEAFFGASQFRSMDCVRKHVKSLQFQASFNYLERMISLNALNEHEIDGNMSSACDQRNYSIKKIPKKSNENPEEIMKYPPESVQSSIFNPLRLFVRFRKKSPRHSHQNHDQPSIEWNDWQ